MVPRKCNSEHDTCENEEKHPPTSGSAAKSANSKQRQDGTKNDHSGPFRREQRHTSNPVNRKRLTFEFG